MNPGSTNLDLLRAIAVLCVFVDHVCLYIFHTEAVLGTNARQLGRAGVLFFFVHTSLVLLMSLERTRAKKIVWNFYLRRAFRIYPLSVLCILLVLSFHIPQAADRAFQSFSPRQVVSNILLIQNLNHDPSVIGPLWSLPWEVQMYLALPLIYLALLRWNTVLLPAGIWLAAVLLRFSNLKGIGIIQYVPCFCGGILAYQLSRKFKPRVPAWIWPLAIALVLILHASLWTSEYSVAGVLGDYIASIVLGAAVPYFNDLRHSWLTRASHTIAKYSYGIYLFHVPLIWFSFYRVPNLGWPWRWALLIGLSCAVPVLTFHLLESPMIRIGRLLAQPIRELGVRDGLKRLIDLAVASIAFVVALPIMAVTAVLIRVYMGGPILFTQDRPGLDGRPFRLYKFRTMTNERDASGKPLGDGARLSALGKFLRNTSLDELPQLWNVIRSDMSLVGPRPLLLHYAPLYSPEQSRRHEVKPGITGWAQVNGRNALSWEQKFELDVWYVDHRSLGLDIAILWRTIGLVLRRASVSHAGHATAPEFAGYASLKSRPPVQ